MSDAGSMTSPRVLVSATSLSLCALVVISVVVVPPNKKQDKKEGKKEEQEEAFLKLHTSANTHFALLLFVFFCSFFEGEYLVHIIGDGIVIENIKATIKGSCLTKREKGKILSSMERR